MGRRLHRTGAHTGSVRHQVMVWVRVTRVARTVVKLGGPQVLSLLEQGVGGPELLT